MNNLNLLFNKHYFNDIADKIKFKESLKKDNEEIFNSCLIKIDSSKLNLDERICPKDQRFLLKTTYPGLLVGTGYNHEAEQGADDCIKLGFSFDYVTGLPYIPGSSVKGLLRNYLSEYTVMKELASKLVPALKEKLTEDMHKLLISNIFDDGDVFFDAVPRCGDSQGHILGPDYITPHTNGLTKSPTPLLMLKILPGVVFEFRFHVQDFKDSNGEECVKAENKITLFKELLMLFGIGAKTNVGYGTFIECNEEEVERHLEAANQNQPNNNGNADARKNNCWGKGGKCKNSPMEGEVICQSCADEARKRRICAICGKSGPKDILCGICKMKTLNHRAN